MNAKRLKGLPAGHVLGEARIAEVEGVGKDNIFYFLFLDIDLELT